MSTDLLLGFAYCFSILAAIALLAGILLWYGEHHPDVEDKLMRRVER